MSETKPKKPPVNGRCPNARCRGELERGEGKPPSHTGAATIYWSCPKCPYFWKES